MIRKLNALGLALAVVLTMSVAMSSAGHASSFTAQTYPATIAGSQTVENALTIEDGLSLKCKKINFHGTRTEASSTEIVTPTISECTAFGIGATVNFNGCAYLFHVGETTGPDRYTSTTDLTCPGESKVVINSGFGQCEVQFKSQAGLGPVELENNTESGDMTFSSTLTGIKYNKTKDNFGCPLTGTGERSNGTYTGATTVRSDSTNIQVSD